MTLLMLDVRRDGNTRLEEMKETCKRHLTGGGDIDGY
jgi:hypothetical protein